MSEKKDLKEEKKKPKKKLKLSFNANQKEPVGKLWKDEEKN